MMSLEDANGHIDDESRVRTRVSRACTRCRSRKDKCDGLRPSCSTCVNADVPQSCTYEPSTKKRGLPEGYVRGLEKLNSLLIARVDGLEQAVVQILRDEKESLARVWNHRVTGEELHTRWKESSILHELETLLGTLDSGSGAGNKRKRERDEEEDRAQSIDSDPSLEGMLTATYSVSSVSPGDAPRTQIRPHIIGSATLSKAPFVLPPGASDSINDYFQFVHCWLPILDRGEMRKKCYELSRREVPVDSTDPGLAKLSAALALASLHVSMIPQAQQALDATYLYEVSKQCIPFMDGLYTLGHVEALILLVLADISGNRWSQAWTTIGLAGRVILDTMTRSLERQETATYQACFVLDTLIAMKLDRMPQMRRSQLPTLLVEDGHEEWEPFGIGIYGNMSTEPGFVISTFNRLTDIFAILNDCICGAETEAQVGDLTRLSQSYPFPISATSQLPPHQLALKAVHFTVIGYLEQKRSSSSTVGLHSVTLASSLLTSSNIPVSSILATALLDTVRQSMPTGDGAVAPNKRQRIHNQVDELNLWPADPFAEPLIQPIQGSGQPQASMGPSREQNLSHSLTRMSTSTGMSLDAPVYPHRDSLPAYNASIATSPSFQGDEIDALFREMAQLDTTEWADGRDQGLKDFGFADALTFEAFCNDPDRVFSGAPQQTDMSIQSNLGFPPLPQHAQAGSNFEPFDMMSTSWNG